MIKKDIGYTPSFATEETKQQFLQKQLEKYREVKSGEATWKDLNEFRQAYGYPDTNVDSLRRSFSQLGNYDDAGWITPTAEGALAAESDNTNLSINYDKDEITSSKVISLSDDELHNPDAILMAHGFDPKDFELKTVNITNSYRTSINGDTNLYSSRVLVRPKTGNKITLKDVEDYFATFNGKKYKGLKIKPTQYDKNGEFLEVPLQDIHMGLLCWHEEVEEDYNVTIARDRVMSLVSQVVDRCKGRKFKRVVLALNGDIIHIDNLSLETTKHTRQTVDSRPQRIFNYALDMLIDCVTNLGTIAPVEVVCVPGNHDKLTSFMLCKALEMAFRGEEKVTFFNDPNPRKFKRYGNVLLGFCHGDVKDHNLINWLQDTAAEDWGKSFYREIHAGHEHHLRTVAKQEENYHGVTLRYLPALCGPSDWENEQCFGHSLRSLLSFVWNEESGLREIMYFNV